MTRGTPLAILAIGLMLAFWGVSAWASATTGIPQLLAWMSAGSGIWLTIDGLGVAIVGLISMLHGSG